MVWNFKAAMGRRKVAVNEADLADLKGQIEAINKTLGVIEFDLQGNIINANENFLKAIGYRSDDVRGQHHRMLVTPAERESEDYRRFWQKLGRGEFDAGQYRRVGKGGRVIYLQASYNPILDEHGNPTKVVKFATDITAQVETSHQMHKAVERTQSVVRSASEGDLSRRIDTNQLSGDALKMSESVNLLLDTFAQMFSDMQAVVSRASSGDLTGRVEVGNKSGELRQGAESVNSLLNGVAEIVQSVTSAADEVLRGAEEISQGNHNLSQRTEQQSASLEETASFMEQMTSTVKQNADNAARANELASAARDQAAKGGSVIGKTVAAMSKINAASTRIADIIGVIDEIAFQTNLLALNAAVEAARAGEQGRGFAVVATEVRSLAGRSARAAREIKELIVDSVKKVEDGSRLVTQSGQTLDQIVTSVKEVSDIVAEIAAASCEQSAGIEQVNQAVTEMDEMTQQNAALVEEAAAASQSMADQARQLTKLMQRYRTGDAAPAGQRAARPAPPARRRSVVRPWSAATKPAATPMAKKPRAPSAPKAAAAGGTSCEWVEF